MTQSKFRLRLAVGSAPWIIWAFLALSAIGRGQALQVLETYKGSDPQTCSAPPASNSFASTDGTVNVYSYLNNMNVNGGDQVEYRWLDSAGNWDWTTAFNPTGSGYTSWCFPFDLSIAQYIAPKGFGNWRVQVYVNGNAAGSAVTFSVTDSGAEPRGPDYSGYFDPIAVDCSHLTGWAKDNNNSGATINVDMAVSGFPTVQAAQSGVFRSGVGNYEWDQYNLQAYEDGAQHQVHVYYHGTTQELPNSPQLFPPAGATSACRSVAAPSIRTGHVVTLPSNPNGTVYYVAATGLYPFRTPQAFYSWGFQFSDVTTANAAEAALPVQSIIIPAKIAGCSDPISQINGTCGSAPLTVSWVSGSAPPPALTSGQSAPVKWQVSGPDQIQSRLCFGSADPATMCQQSGNFWQNSGTNTSGTFGDVLPAPGVNGPQTVYVTVQAQANGQTVYAQPVAQVMVTPSTAGAATWVFGSDPNLNNLTVIVQEQASGTSHQYRFNVINTGGFSSDLAMAHLTVVAPHEASIKVHRTSLAATVLYDNGPSAFQAVQNVDGAPWQNVNQLWNDYTVLAKDVLGFVPVVGTAIGIGDLVQDTMSILNAIGSVGPSGGFNAELNDDGYDVYGIDVSVGPFLGTRIVVNADQFGSASPHFFLTMKESGSTVVGMELRDKQSAAPCANFATGSDGSCWVPVFRSVN